MKQRIYTIYSFLCMVPFLLMLHITFICWIVAFTLLYPFEKRIKGYWRGIGSAYGALVVPLFKKDDD